MAENYNPVKDLRITLVQSAIGYTVRHKATVRALGFHRLHQTVEHEDTPRRCAACCTKVNHLVQIEELNRRAGAIMKLNDLLPNQARRRTASVLVVVSRPVRVKPPVAVPKARDSRSGDRRSPCTVRAVTCRSSARLPFHAW